MIPDNWDTALFDRHNGEGGYTEDEFIADMYDQLDDE